MDHIKSPGAQKAFGLFLKCRNVFMHTPKRFLKSPRRFWGTYRKTVRFPAIDSFE